MLNSSISDMTKTTLHDGMFECFLSASEINYAYWETRSAVDAILGCDKFEIAVLETKKLEILGLLSRIESLALEKIWEDDRIIRHYENILSFWEKLNEKYWKICQWCLCRHLLSWDEAPRKEIEIVDFEWEDSILSHLIEQYAQLSKSITTRLNC